MHSPIHSPRPNARPVPRPGLPRPAVPAIPSRSAGSAPPGWQAVPRVPVTAEGEAILARARTILAETGISEAERQVRLQVVRATLTGAVIRPSEASPEMRNPEYWTLVDDTYIVLADEIPVEAIDDLWVLHHHDGLPIPRVRCLKYTTLILIQGFIQHFLETGHAEGLAALNQLFAHRVIPQGLPNSGDNILWRRRLSGDGLLPGDQVWFDNPLFDRGRALYHKRFYQEALQAGKSPEEALASATAEAEAATAGEEGSNVFYLGDDKFILGADSLVRPYREACDPSSQATHELVFTPKIYNLTRFREHMIDDNYSVQACLRAVPDMVRPECFTIERVRAPLDPEYLLRHHAIQTPEQSFGALVDALASRNPPPRLVQAGDTVAPLFDEDYDWGEQRRVREALDAVMRSRCDETWWPMRDRFGDDRYVLTATRGGVAVNFTIGMLCQDLVDLRLCLGFTRHLPLVPGKLPASFRPERAFWRNEAQWKRERKPLYAMQAALCEAAIAQWESVTGTEPGADGRTHRYLADEKARFVTALEQEIAARNQTRQAVCEEVIMPWLPAPIGWEGFDAERARELMGDGWD